MKRFDSCRLLLSACLFVLSVGFSSCVNEEYDLKKDIDTDMTILRNVALPIGNMQKITLNELLELTTSSDKIRTDDEGNLALMIADPTNVLSQTVYAPDFTLEDSYTGLQTEAYIGDFYVAYDPAYGEVIGEYFDVTKPRPFPKPVNIIISFVEENIPKEIKEIRYAEVDALASLNISIRDNNNGDIPLKVVLAAGTEIVFPDWVVLGKLPSDFDVDGTRVTLNKNLSCRLGTSENQHPISIDFPIVGIDATKLPEGQGINADRQLVMDDKIVITGQSYLDISELGTVPPSKVSPIISTFFEFSKIDVKNIEVMLSDDLDIDVLSGLSPITLDKLPEFLADEGVVLDLADVRLDIDMINSTPFSGKMSTVIESYTDDKVIAVKNLGPAVFDAGSPDDPAEVRWSFSEGTLPVPAGYVHYDVPGLTDLIETLPKYIRFKEFAIDIDNEYLTIFPGEKYVVEETYSLYAPLAFGPDFRLPYTFRIEDIGFEFSEVAISSLRLEMDVESTVPLEFDAEVSLLGNDGNVVDGLDIKVLDNAVLKAGTLDSPVMSELAFEITAAGSKFAFDGIELYLDASATGNEINSLNVNQSLHVKNVVVRLPEGISLDMSGLTE